MSTTSVRLFERMQGLQTTIIERLMAADKRYNSNDPYPAIGHKLENLIQFMNSCKVDPDEDENFTTLIDTLVKTVLREKYIGVDTLLVWVMVQLDKYHLHEQMWTAYQSVPEKHQAAMRSFLPPHYQSAATLLA